MAPQKTPHNSSAQTDGLAAESFVLTLPDDPASAKDWYLWAGVLALLVFVVFFPAVEGQSLWDDEHHVGLIDSFSSLDGLRRIWIPQDATPQYYPLTFTTFWLEHLLWQDNTLGYHIDNMLLHSASAVLVWLLLRRLRLPGAWLAAALWAIHPMQAESVCWMSERKNTLSGLLFFASIWFYLEYDDGPAEGAKNTLTHRRAAYCASWLCFALALLAKTVACAMPAVMLIMAWWRGRKLLDRKTILPLIPFFAAGVGLAGLTVYLESFPGGNVGARGPDWDLSIVQRLLIAGRGVWFYVGKLFWPAKLTFSYPRLVPDPRTMGAAMYGVQWLYVAGAAAVVAVLLAGRKLWGRGPLAAVLYYAVTLFPSLGFINIYPMRYSFVADHFQYLSGLGLIVLTVAAGSAMVKKLHVPIGAATALSVALVVALFCPAWVQAHIYDSPESLWRDTLAKNPDSWMADDNLGVELIKLGEQKERDAANDQMQQQPDAAADDTQDAQNKFKEAEVLFHRALALRPQNYATYNALGLLYRHLGRWQEAEVELKTSVEMDDADEHLHRLIAPYVDYAQVYQNNHPDADIRPWLDKALELATLPHSRPQEVGMARLAYGGYWMRLAAAASKANHTDEEMADLQQAAEQLSSATAAVPEDITGLFDLARAYDRMGVLDQEKADRERAAGHLQEAGADEYKSHQIDDARAMQNYLAVTSRVPFGRYAPALEGIGKLYFRNVVERDNQADAVHDLLTSLQFFKDAIATDATVPDAAHFLPIISRQLSEQGLKAVAHESAWAPLRERAAALAAGSVTKAAADDVQQAAETVLWPLPRTHPLYQPLLVLRTAIRNDDAADAPAGAAQAVATAAGNVIKAMADRKPDVDALGDAESAALCFQGALTADEHSAQAWRNLQVIADTLAKDVAVTPDAPGAKEALRVATSVLDQHRAATQPTTAPSATTAPAR